MTNIFRWTKCRGEEIIPLADAEVANGFIASDQFGEWHTGERFEFAPMKYLRVKFGNWQMDTKSFENVKAMCDAATR